MKQALWTMSFLVILSPLISPAQTRQVIDCRGNSNGSEVLVNFSNPGGFRITDSSKNQNYVLLGSATTATEIKYDGVDDVEEVAEATLYIPNSLPGSGRLVEKDKETSLNCKEGLQSRIQSVQSFLDSFDLEAIHLSTSERGAPGLFLALPKMATIQMEGSTPKVQEDMAIAYYFKSRTGLSPSGAFNPQAPAKEASTGSSFGYPCIVDQDKEIADLNLLNINSALVSAATTPFEKLLALARGSRYVAGNRGGVYVDCSPHGGVQNAYDLLADGKKSEIQWDKLPDGKIVQPNDFAGADVQVWAHWNSGSWKEIAGADGKTRTVMVDENGNLKKADDFSIINFGDFTWVKTKDGKLKNADQLIQIYRDLGFEYLPAARK